MNETYHHWSMNAGLLAPRCQVDDMRSDGEDEDEMAALRSGVEGLDGPATGRDAAGANHALASPQMTSTPGSAQKDQRIQKKLLYHLHEAQGFARFNENSSS